VGAAGYFIYSNGIQIGPSPASQDTGILSLSGNVKAATVLIDGKQRASALPATIQAVPTGRRIKVTVTSNGFKKFTQELELQSGETGELRAVLERDNDGASVAANSSATQQSGEPGKMVSVRLNVIPGGVGTTMKINGAAIDSSGVATVAADTPFELRVERDGFRVYRQTVVVDSKKLEGGSEWAVDVKLEPAKFGFVSIKTTPSADIVLNIDGIEEKWSTPVSRRRIPVGTYKAKLVNNLLGMEKEVSFTVSEDRFTNIEERLLLNDEPARVPGSQ
jgi:hypothetical protein